MENTAHGAIRRVAIGSMVAAIFALSANPASADARRWTRVDPSPPSPPRSAVAMAFDPVSGLVVSFGGYDDSGSYLDQTWTWDGTGWTPVSVASPPPARAAAGLAFDQATQKLVLFGGYDGTTYLGDTWLWDGTTMSWTPASPSRHPPNVTGPAIFQDPLTGRVEEFGGFNGHLYQNQTWEWTGSDWMQLHPADVPGARSAGIVELDRANRTVVMFSGLGDLNVYDTWTWDGTDWTKAAPAHQPPSRFYSASAYDPATRTVVIFGGSSPFGDLGDTWTWNGTDWRQIRPGRAPAPRESQAMAYDGATGTIVLFGGEVHGGVVAQTWML